MSVLRILALAGMCAACSGGNVAAPGVPERSYAGDWTGTTSQGTGIELRVSAQNILTSITIGRDFNGCRDTHMFSSLSVVIGESGLPGRVPTPSTPGFGFGSGSPEGPNFVQVIGQFTSSQIAQGTVTFLNVEKCGNAVAHWNATRR
jgi:hypothetical protein